MAITVIQACSSATGACTFGSNVTAGSSILFGGFSDTTGALTSVADTPTNTYALIKKQLQSASSAWPCELWIGQGAAGGGATTVTGTWSGTPNKLCIAVEVSGLAVSPAGTPIGNDANTSANPNIGNITPASIGDLAVALVANVNNKTPTAGSGFTIPANGTVTGSGNGLGFEYQIAPSTSAIAAAFTMASSEWNGVAVMLAAAGGGGGRTTFGRPGLDGHSIAGIKQFNPVMYHRHPMLSLDAYRRQQAQTHREFMAKVSQRAA